MGEDRLTMLGALWESADGVWKQYLNLGPGNMPADALDEFHDRLAACKSLLNATRQSDLTLEWRQRFDSAANELDELFRRCVSRPEGLCFVTGEAGLIPRSDLHQRCTDALRTLRGLLD